MSARFGKDVGCTLFMLVLLSGCYDNVYVIEENDDTNEDAAVPPDSAPSPDATAVSDTGVPASVDAGVPDPGHPDAAVEPPDAGSAGEPDAMTGCVFDGDPFDPALLQARVGFLASDPLEGRAPGTAGDLATRTHIEDRFRCLGLSPLPGGSYQQPFLTSEGQMTANVAGYIQGSDPVVGNDIIVVSAHHDHLGIMNGRIYNGANDNASGVAAVLALAQAIKQRPTPPRRTIAFITFGFEEHDGACEGSEYYVANPPATLPIERVVYDVNLDMVGLYANAESLSAYGAAVGTHGRALLQGLAGSYPGIDIDLDAEAEEDDSDFQAFCDAGVPYVYLETWDDNCYHQGCDDAGRLDYPGLATISRLATDLLVAISDTSIDLAASRAQSGCASGP